MKILFLNEIIDELGHYDSYNFKDVDFDYILNSFLTKANGVHTILTFKADTMILNKQPDYPYKVRIYNNEKVKNFILKNTKKSFNIGDISFNKYDVIWCRDDILNIKDLKLKYPNILFVYENVEHCFSKINIGYDLILDHTDFSFKKLNKLNSRVSFPYVIDKNILRRNINCTDKNKDIYVDSRDVYKWAKINNIQDQNIGMIKLFFQQIKDFFKKNNFEIISNIPRPEICYNLIDKKSDVKEYLSKIASCKYFVLSFNRCGQSLVEAAALNCIVFGNKNSMNTPYICHEKCIFNDVASPLQILNKIKDIDSNTILQKEILDYQDKMLQKYFYEHQKNILKDAIELLKN